MGGYCIRREIHHVTFKLECTTSLESLPVDVLLRMRLHQTQGCRDYHSRYGAGSAHVKGSTTNTHTYAYAAQHARQLSSIYLSFRKHVQQAHKRSRSKRRNSLQTIQYSRFANTTRLKPSGSVWRVSSSADNDSKQPKQGGVNDKGGYIPELFGRRERRSHQTDTTTTLAIQQAEDSPIDL